MCTRFSQRFCPKIRFNKRKFYLFVDFRIRNPILWRECRNALPYNPSGEKEEGDALGALLLEIREDLWNFCNSPTEHTHEAEGERHLVSTAADAILEVCLHPLQAVLLRWAEIRYRPFHVDFIFAVEITCGLEIPTSSKCLGRHSDL